MSFVRDGGGLVWVIWAKSTLPFKGAEEAVPMPLKEIVPVAYPDFEKAREDATTLASTDPFFAGIDFSSLKDEKATAPLPHLLRERTIGKGRALALYGAFGPSWKYLSYATYEKVPGGWDICRAQILPRGGQTRHAAPVPAPCQWFAPGAGAAVARWLSRP